MPGPTDKPLKLALTVLIQRSLTEAEMEQLRQPAVRIR
jgi:hypothetical protein